MQSFQPGENWVWCFVDQDVVGYGLYKPKE